MKIEDAIINEEIPVQAEVVEEQQVEEQQGNGLQLNFQWLKTKTGEGPISSYIDHPLNFNNSDAMAHIIRGATGFFDSLDLAIIDIAVGIFKMTNGRKKNAATT